MQHLKTRQFKCCGYRRFRDMRIEHCVSQPLNLPTTTIVPPIAIIPIPHLEIPRTTSIANLYEDPIQEFLNDITLSTLIHSSI